MTVKPNILLRKARDEDRDKVIWVESLSTPNLSYVQYVWDMFLNDKTGDWSVEEVDGEIFACGKYSILPDGSAWLETLRVIPARQGIGLGKRLYEHWLKLSKEKGVKTMRMYTGVKNVVSKGLAERYGFTLAETFHGTLMNSEPVELKPETDFKAITDTKQATELLMPLSEKWGGWMVMNRTYHKWSPELCKWLTEKGMVYRDSVGNVIVIGARFMPEFQLHIGLFDGDAEKCLDFAKKKAAARGVKTLHCLYPEYCVEAEKALTGNGFKMEAAPFIAMEINL
ncbi:MAG: GNAT family N-acetyltransferase [Candidatus Bathyarchaeota archaeon]|nr:GNAT family N-acetyltransferase [Candidatus Bathyarchaeota archaeon]